MLSSSHFSVCRHFWCSWTLTLSGAGIMKGSMSFTFPDACRYFPRPVWHSPDCGAANFVSLVLDPQDVDGTFSIPWGRMTVHTSPPEILLLFLTKLLKSMTKMLLVGLVRLEKALLSDLAALPVKVPRALSVLHWLKQPRILFFHPAPKLNLQDLVLSGQLQLARDSIEKQWRELWPLAGPPFPYASNAFWSFIR